MSAPLKCPRCGSTYMHQQEIAVYARGEDDRARIVTIDQYTGRAIDAIALEKPNPSPRRQGLRVRVMCEGCSYEHGDLWLCMYQHKGQTFVEFDE